MINKSKIRWKLLQLVLLVSLVTLVTAAILDVVLQAKSASLSSQSEMTNRWLKGEVFKSNDPRLKTIIERLAADLHGARTHFVTPQAQQTAAPMFKAAEAADPNNKADEATDPKNKAAEAAELQKNPVETWELPVKKDKVYVSFEGFMYYKFDSEKFANTSTTPPVKPEKRDYDRDEMSYKSFMYSYFEAVRGARIVKREDSIEAAMQKYSDAISGSLRVGKDLTDKSPKLTISSIFAADDTNGTLAIFPWNSRNLARMKPEDWNFKTRPWRTAAYAKPDEMNGAELFSIPENNDPTSAFGLSPFYVDAVTGDYTRTLWHRFTVSTEWEKETTYILCMDLNLSSSLPPLLTGNVMPSWIVERGGLTETLLVGLFSGLTVLVVGSIFTLLLSRLRPQLLSYFLVRRQTKEWVTEESYIPIEQAFAPQRSITFTDMNQHQAGVERKVSFSAWFQMNVAKLAFEKSKHDKELSQTEKREEVKLNTIDKDPSLRGYEVWRVFRSRWRSEGSCRLCGQEVKYKASDEPIAEPTIRHRRTQIPAIDTRLAANSAVKDTRALEEAIIWQATDVKPGVLGTAYTLKPGPPPRIPQTIQDLSEFKQNLKAFNMLSQSRIDVGDCVRLSSELFPNRNVRAVCHIDYFRKIASGGDSSLAALKQGKNIERILVANKPEDMVQFLSKHRDTLEDLLNVRNQELFRLYLDDTGVDFSTFGNQRFDLDFAIVYGDNELPLVLASNLSELHSGGSVKGYLSWRMVDVYFFQTLYESFTDKRVTLRLDDLPQMGLEVQ